MPTPTAHCTLTSRVERLTFDLRGLDPIRAERGELANFVPRRLVLDVLRDQHGAPVQLLACASERMFGGDDGGRTEWCSPSHPDQPATPLSAMPVPLRAIVLAYVPDAQPLFV